MAYIITIPVPITTVLYIYRGRQASSHQQLIGGPRRECGIRRTSKSTAVKKESLHSISKTQYLNK